MLFSQFLNSGMDTWLNDNYSPIPVVSRLKIVSCLIYYSLTIIVSNACGIPIDYDLLLVELFNILGLEYDGLPDNVILSEEAIKYIPLFLAKLVLHSHQINWVNLPAYTPYLIFNAVNPLDFANHLLTNLNIYYPSHDPRIIDFIMAQNLTDVQRSLDLNTNLDLDSLAQRYSQHTGHPLYISRIFITIVFGIVTVMLINGEAVFQLPIIT
jgi:hypothetical protein